MSCLECGSTTSIFNEALGEKVCEECGFVLVEGMFEETVGAFSHGQKEWIHSIDNNRLGSVNYRYDKKDYNLHRGISLSKMLLTSLTKTNQRGDRLENLYTSCFRAGLFGTVSYEDRATALVFFLLREDNLPFTIKELCKEYNTDSRVVYRLSKKIAVHLGKPNVFSSIPLSAFAERYAEMLGDGSFVRDCGIGADALVNKFSLANENIRPSTHAALISLIAKATGVEFTRKELSDATGISVSTIRVEGKRILNVLGVENIEGRGLNWLL